MQMSGNTVLITGGSSGIGRALAARFLAAGNKVIVTGRRAGLLDELKQQYPAVLTRVCDAGSEIDRAALARDMVREFPDLNVVINNAGIQRKIDLVKGEPWRETEQEIAINLAGPIHLSMLFLPHLVKQPRAVLMNVSSGLAFVPIARMPVYCATKAALHSFTQSLRHQVQGTPVQVVEIIPPAVKSNLGGSHDFGVDTDEYADSVMAQLAEGRLELTYDMSARASQASRAELDEIFKRMNSAV